MGYSSRTGRQTKIRFCQTRREDVSLNVINADDRDVERVSKCLRKRDSHEEAPNKSWPIRDCDSIDLPVFDLSGLERLSDDRHDQLHMRPGGILRHHTSKLRVDRL